MISDSFELWNWSLFLTQPTDWNKSMTSKNAQCSSRCGFWVLKISCKIGVLKESQPPSHHKQFVESSPSACYSGWDNDKAWTSQEWKADELMDDRMGDPLSPLEQGHASSNQVSLMIRKEEQGHSNSSLEFKYTISKDPVSRWEIFNNFGYKLSGRWQDRIGPQHPEGKKFVFGVFAWWKCSWRMKTSCWTLRHTTPMTTWKARSRESTQSTAWTRERALSVAVFVVSSVLSHSSLAHRTLAQDLRVVVSFHPMVIAMYAWVELSPWFPWFFSSSSLSSSHSSLSSSSSFCLSISPRLSS